MPGLSAKTLYRLGLAAALLVALLTVLANGAVGLIGDEDNRYNLLFLAVLPLAMIGAILARFRPAGLALAMLVAGIAYAAVALGGLAADPRGALFSLVFASLWFVSAASFRASAE